MESSPETGYIELENGPHSVRQPLTKGIVNWWSLTSSSEWLTSDLSRRKLIFPMVFTVSCVSATIDIFSMFAFGQYYLVVDIMCCLACIIAAYKFASSNLVLDAILCSIVFISIYAYESVPAEDALGNRFFEGVVGCFFLFLFGIHSAFIAVGAIAYCFVEVMRREDSPLNYYTITSIANVVVSLPFVALVEYRCAQAAKQIAWAESVLRNARGVASSAVLSEIQDPVDAEKDVVEVDNDGDCFPLELANKPSSPRRPSKRCRGIRMRSVSEISHGQCRRRELLGVDKIEVILDTSLRVREYNFHFKDPPEEGNQLRLPTFQSCLVGDSKRLLDWVQDAANKLYNDEEEDCEEAPLPQYAHEVWFRPPTATCASSNIVLCAEYVALSVEDENDAPLNVCLDLHGISQMVSSC